MDLSNWKLKLKIGQPNYVIARNNSAGDPVYISGVFQSKENAVKELGVRVENYKKDSRPDGWGEPYLLQLTVSVKEV